MNQNSYLEENFDTLKELKILSQKKKEFIIEKSGPDLVLSICEIFFNLIQSNKDSLIDKNTIKIIKKNLNDIGILINKHTSIKQKKI